VTDVGDVGWNQVTVVALNLGVPDGGTQVTAVCTDANEARRAVPGRVDRGSGARSVSVATLATAGNIDDAVDMPAGIRERSARVDGQVATLAGRAGGVSTLGWEAVASAARGLRAVDGGPGRLDVRSAWEEGCAVAVDRRAARAVPSRGGAVDAGQPAPGELGGKGSVHVANRSDVGRYDVAIRTGHFSVPIGSAEVALVGADACGCRGRVPLGVDRGGWAIDAAVAAGAAEVDVDDAVNVGVRIHKAETGRGIRVAPLALDAGGMGGIRG